MLRIVNVSIVFVVVSAWIGACDGVQGGSLSCGGGWGQGQAALLCGLPSVDAPSERPVDPCRDGTQALAPTRFVLDRGSDEVETLAFTIPGEMHGCVGILSGGSDQYRVHRVSSGWIDLDGERVVGPERFNQNVTTIEERRVLSGGDHMLAVRLAGPPGAWAEVGVRVGGDGAQHAPVNSDHLKLFNLYADPSVFHGYIAPTRLTASGTVSRLSGLPSGGSSFKVRWRFEIRRIDSCALVRTLGGETALHTSTTFAPEASWDGRDSSGVDVPGGAYAYLLVADLIRVSSSGETVVESLATAQQTVTLDRLYGYVDLHTHPMSHLGFGEKLMHGAPDTDMIVPSGNDSCNAEPYRASTVAEALGNCSGTHGGWGLDNMCGDYLRAGMVSIAADENFVYRTSPPLMSDHQHEGYPNLTYWPHQSSLVHQQMWWEWLKRAHQGGLNVIVALTVNSELLAELVNGTPPYDDRSVAERQIAETIRMVNNHHDFMEVATSSSELLRIVSEGKLAVVLGMEIDRIGNFGVLSVPSEAAVRGEIRHLHDLGIRYIFPVHLVDNAFGGSAVYSPEFSFANKRANGYHYLVEHSADPDVTYDASKIKNIPFYPGAANTTLISLRGALDAIGEMPAPCVAPTPECILFPFRVACCGSFQQVINVLEPSPEWDVYSLIPPGHVNSRGLTSSGEIAINELMKLGMFIDLDHMSERTQERVIEIAEGTRAVTSGAGYPLVFGHGGIRHGGTSDTSSTERLPPLRLVERVAALRGMFGAGSDNATPDEFIANYRQLRAVMGPGSVGLGTDVNGFARLPRRSAECAIGADTTGSQNFYQSFLGAGTGPTTKSTLGNRTWDYVLDCGVSHYGLLPEFLFDVGTFHGGGDVRDDLMGSVAGFIRMWQRIEAASTRIP